MLVTIVLHDLSPPMELLGIYSFITFFLEAEDATSLCAKFLYRKSKVSVSISKAATEQDTIMIYRINIIRNTRITATLNNNLRLYNRLATITTVSQFPAIPHAPYSWPGALGVLDDRSSSG
jgi:hypothetical protein